MTSAPALRNQHRRAREHLQLAYIRDGQSRLISGNPLATITYASSIDYSVVAWPRWNIRHRSHKAGSKKRYSTGDSQEITQPSTNPAQPGLSCEF